MTLRFDWNTNSDVGYISRMLVAGPTLINTSVLLLRESNAPSGAFPPISAVRGRYTYKAHPMLSADWGIVLSPLLSLDGYANFIANKGRDEVDNATGAETTIDLQLMFDVGAMAGGRKKIIAVHDECAEIISGVGTRAGFGCLIPTGRR